MLRKGGSFIAMTVADTIDSVITVGVLVTSIIAIVIAINIAIVIAMVRKRIMATRVVSVPWSMASVSSEAFSFVPIVNRQYF